MLDNCEHLLDATASLAVELLGACPALWLLTTSREPIGVAGEVSWRVPSLSLADEAIELFIDRARHGRPDFRITDDDTTTVAEICRRLDGMPLAIELAAARVRALSLAEILDSLHDRFRLLTGGARTAVRRQQTLRASVDWSHALLTAPERVLFRRLAVFLGGFDFDAAQAVAGGGDVQRYQVLDQLTLLVDKSLVVADDTCDGMRYRLLETVRQYAQEKLGESGEADEVRTRHRDHYTATAAELESHGHTYDEQLVHWAQSEIDNLRAAFVWSRENSDLETAGHLVIAAIVVTGRPRPGGADRARRHLDRRQLHGGNTGGVGARTTQCIFYTADDEKVAVSDNMVVSTVTIYQQTPGSVLAARGAAVDPDATTYLVKTAEHLIWPYDDTGRLVGEDVWEYDESVREIIPLDPTDVLTVEQSAKLLAPLIKPLPTHNPFTA